MARNNTAEVEDVVDGESTEDVSAAKPEKAPKKQKHEMPEGYGTPVDFTKILLEKRGVTVKPQVIFGHVKHSKTFQAFTDQHTDGRTRVHLDSALAWYDEKEARKAEKAAAKPEEVAAE